MEENRQGLSDIVVETRRDGTSVLKRELHSKLQRFLMTLIFTYSSIKDLP